MKRFTQALAFVLIAALCLAFSIAALAARPIEEIGSQVINPVASTALTVPSGTQHIMFTVRTAGVHVSLDSTAATTSDLYLPAGAYAFWDQGRMIPDLRYIDSSDGASTVSVKFLRNR